MAEPYNPDLDPRMQALFRRLRAIPTTGNEARRQTALGSLQQLLTSGFFEDGSITEAEKRASGIKTEAGKELDNLLFGVQLGPRGRIFRNALADDARQFNARGSFFSSARMDAQRNSLTGIQSNVNAALNAATRAQRESFATQAEATSGIQSDIVSLREDLLRERADRDLPGEYDAPAPTPTDAQEGAPQPAATPGSDAQQAAQANGKGIIRNAEGKAAQYAFNPQSRPNVWKKITGRYGAGTKVKRTGSGSYVLVRG